MDEVETMTAVPEESGRDPWWRRRRWVIAGAFVALGGLAAGVVVALLPDNQDPYPETWAAEVRPFVEVVEDERGLEFEHPVYVDFLPSKEFEKEVTADESELSEEDEEEIEQTAGLMRAVGLIEGDVDLFEAVNDVAGAGTLAFYSYKDKRISIRGEKLTPAIEVTLVHELTHALQDQHFDLGKRIKEFDDADNGSGPAFEALIEGDARRIEAEYLERLDDEQRDEIEKEEEQASEAYSDRVSDLPPVMTTLVGAPYSLGEAMLALAALDDGNEAVDELFERPPATDEHLLDPWTLIRDRDEPVEVETPSLDEGVEELDSGSFGALGWYLVLAERIPLLQALDATDGWGGDAYVSFEYAGSTCVQIAYQGDTIADVRQMTTALERWSAVLPKSPARVERSGDGLLFTSCDPGPDADVGKEASADALLLALSRTYAAVNLMKDGAPEEITRCLADSLIHGFSQKELGDRELQQSAAFQARLTEMVEACS